MRYCLSKQELSHYIFSSIILLLKSVYFIPCRLRHIFRFFFFKLKNVRYLLFKVNTLRKDKSDGQANDKVDKIFSRNSRHFQPEEISSKKLRFQPFLHDLGKVLILIFAKFWRIWFLFRSRCRGLAQVGPPLKITSKTEHLQTRIRID